VELEKPLPVLHCLFRQRQDIVAILSGGCGVCPHHSRLEVKACGFRFLLYAVYDRYSRLPLSECDASRCQRVTGQTERVATPEEGFNGLVGNRHCGIVDETVSTMRASHTEVANSVYESSTIGNIPLATVVFLKLL
jgi:hypothetical protein